MRQTLSATTSGYLIIFGPLLILLGVMGYLTHPEKAHTALIFGGGFGAVSLVWGILGAREVRWVRPAALFTTTLLCAACIWRASLSWLAVANGQAEKLYASIIITLMLTVSAAMLFVLLKNRAGSVEQTPGGGS